MALKIGEFEFFKRMLIIYIYLKHGNRTDTDIQWLYKNLIKIRNSTTSEPLRLQVNCLISLLLLDNISIIVIL